MNELAFWLKQPTIDVLTAAYLLAGEPLPEELSHTVNDTSYPPRVTAMIRLIKERTGAVVRSPRSRSRGASLSTTISNAEFQQLAGEMGPSSSNAMHSKMDTPLPDSGLKARERNNLLRIIRALDSMNPKPLPLTGYAESIRAKLAELGLAVVSDDTIRKAIEDARRLDS